ncbi:MAG: hypothetical protein CM1200mP29_02740 [Verrucomicrobiota bacterium]|nr:MAG: hypothetical protein CM1200mP29_02740 [Verrucomicrobiota bacterium]
MAKRNRDYEPKFRTLDEFGRENGQALPVVNAPAPTRSK